MFLSHQKSFLCCLPPRGVVSGASENACGYFYLNQPREDQGGTATPQKLNNTNCIDFGVWA